MKYCSGYNFDESSMKCNAIGSGGYHTETFNYRKKHTIKIDKTD